MKREKYGFYLRDTNLWYRDETLELTEIKAKEKKEEKVFTEEELEERFRKQREEYKALILVKLEVEAQGVNPPAFFNLI